MDFRAHEESRMKKNRMTCEEFVESLQKLLVDELTPADRVRASKHLAGCHQCSAYLDDYKRTIELAKSAAADAADLTALPESLIRRIVNARKS